MPILSLPTRWQVAAVASPTVIERRNAVLVKIDAWDPVTAAVVTLYAGSHDDPEVCHTMGQTWWPALSKLPVLRYDLFDGAFEGEISSPTSALTLRTEPWPNIGRYSFPDARLRLWTGTPDSLGGNWTLRFDGRVTAQPKISNGAAEIAFGVDDKWLDASLLATYAGTTGAEGPAELKGQPKPLALGAPRFVPGKLIDSINSVFQVSGYGAIQGVEKAFDKLIAFPAPTADYPTYAALVAATIPAGSWATAKAVGMARFGAPPLGLVSFQVQGDIAGPNGWARKPGQLIRRLALISGGAGKIDDASLDALDALRPYNLSLYADQQTTARQLIQSIAASLNAVAGVSWLGKLFLVPIGIGAPTVTLAADGSALPAVSSVEQIEIAAPWRKLHLGAQRTWAVHALSDIAFTAPLIDRGQYEPGETYREGNIVSLGDGSRWLYVSTTPTAGNMPAVGSTFWENMSAALVALTIRLTNEAHVLTAEATGAVVSYAGASGTVQVLDGATDVSSYFTLATPTGGNPQGLTVTYAAMDYAVTGGLDDAEAGATLTIRASGSGPYAGVFADSKFSIAKAIAGEKGDYRDARYIRSLAQPAAPTGDEPAGWSNGIPAGTATIWSTIATKTADGHLVGAWSLPQSLSALTIRGAYSAAEVYYLNHLVTYGGGSYVAVQDNFSGHAPSGTGQANAFWDVYAAPGEPGLPATPPSGFSATINLPSGAAINLRSIADANGYTGLSDATITFKVPNGVTIRGLGGSGVGIDTGTWPSAYAIALTLIVEAGGIVDGGGGNGGPGGSGWGGAGGDAIYCRTALSGGVTINSGGIVRGGGGGGGGGATSAAGKLGGGGGGGGAPNGSGGPGDSGSISGGSDGSDSGGSGGGGGGGPGGGAGGSYGAAGSNGTNSGAGTGGPAGFAVRKNGNAVSVTNNGTMTGSAA